MRVLEVLNTKSKPLSEDKIESRLRNFNWNFEFSEDLMDIANGQRELQVLENLIYQYWKQEPEKAIALWNKTCPYVSESKDAIPSFIYKLQTQEEIFAK